MIFIRFHSISHPHPQENNKHKKLFLAPQMTKNDATETKKG